VQKVHFAGHSGSKENGFYNKKGIRKANLLSEYVTLMKNWIIDARAGCNDKVKYMQEPPVQIMRRCMVYPPVRPIYPKMKTWERKSCKLHVSAGYHQIFSLYRRHYQNEMRQIRDKSLNKELKVLNRLLEDHGSSDNKKKVDDWYSDF
jgi:hypothetical protein